MSFIKKIKDKIAYEKESYRLSQEHTKKVAEELPFPKGYWRMTHAEIVQWRHEQRKSK